MASDGKGSLIKFMNFSPFVVGGVEVAIVCSIMKKVLECVCVCVDITLYIERLTFVLLMLELLNYIGVSGTAATSNWK